MSLKYFSKYALKPQPLLPKTFVTTSIFLKHISNEPLQKSNDASEANFANSRDNVSPQEEPVLQEQSNKSKENYNVYVNTAPETSETSETSPATSVHYSLVQKRDSSEVLLNADPFEEVPGPVFLKKISRMWKYVPDIGSQATVSALLSFFNLTQKISVFTKLVRPNTCPFDGLFRKYGPIVKLQGALGADVVLICRPEHMAKVYSQEGQHPIRSTLDSIEKCREKSRKICGGPFNISGIEWEEMRRALQEPLTKGAERYFDSFQEASDLFVKRIQLIRNRQNEVPNEFMSEVTKFALECFCCVTLGRCMGFLCPEACNSLEPNRLLKAVDDAVVNLCKCESGFQLWRFVRTKSLINLRKACGDIDGFISKHIRLAQVNLTKNKDEIINKGKTEDTLPFIENLLLNECMAPEEVLTCIVDLLLIGVSTTSSSLAFTLYHLAQNQRAQRILFKEIKEVLPEKQSQLQLQDLPSLKYLEACINESHRLKMPMPTLSRVLPCDIVLSNFRIPKGTYVVMDLQATCLKEQNFEKYDKYIPERWLDASNIQPFSFIPFGHGPRSCVGKRMAEVQLKTSLAKIIRNFQVEYNYGDIRATKTVISFPDKPLKLSFLEREE